MDKIEFKTLFGVNIASLDNWTYEFINRLKKQLETIKSQTACAIEDGKATFINFNNPDVLSYVNFIKQLNKGLFIKRNKKLSEQLTLYFDSATLYDEFLNNKDKILKILRQLDPDPATNIRSTNYANNVGIWYIVMLSEFLTNDNERIDSLGEHYVDCHISSLLNDLVDAINSATIKNDVFKFIKSNINKLKTNFNNYKSKATQPKPAGEQRNVFTHYQKIYDFAKCLKHIRLNTSKENRLSENDIKWSYILTIINWLIYCIFEELVNPFGNKELNITEFWGINPR